MTPPVRTMASTWPLSTAVMAAGNDPGAVGRLVQHVGEGLQLLGRVRDGFGEFSFRTVIDRHLGGGGAGVHDQQFFHGIILSSGEIGASPCFQMGVYHTRPEKKREIYKIFLILLLQLEEKYNTIDLQTKAAFCRIHITTTIIL